MKTESTLVGYEPEALATGLTAEQPSLTLPARSIEALVLLVILLSASLTAAGSSNEPPLRGRPENFSGLVGLYTIAVSATPTEVCVEDPVIVTVRLDGHGPTEPERRKLRIFPSELADDFYVEDVPQQDSKTDKSWSFVYRLRPKHTDVKFVPSFELVYYLPERKKYQTAVSAAVALNVKPRPVAPIRAPEYFFELAGAPDVLEEWGPGLLSQAWVIVLLLLAPPAGCGLWCWCWRRLQPDGVHQARRRRSRAAETALNMLRSAETADAARLRACVAGYLQERTELRHVEPTPQEVSRHLRRLGVSRELVLSFGKFFDACDADRFAPHPAARLSSPDQAIQLILALEAEPCSRRAS